MKAIIGVVILLILGREAIAMDNPSRLLLETIAREASGEHIDAEIKVCRVIRNRMRERGLTADEVVLQPKQFSCWNEDADQKPRTKEELRRAAASWVASEHCVSKANHYHNIKKNDPTWKPDWAKSMEYLGQVGRIKFYYEKR